MEKKKKEVTLYLTGWQKRMVKDVLDIDVSFLTIPIDDDPIVMYAVRTGKNKVVKEMYLTSQQMEQIQHEFGIRCSFIEIS